MLCGGAPVSRCCWAQGCQCIRQPLAHSGAAAIGARNDDRSIICSARRCTVDSDAVLLRARHGGRHEGGGRRQRKRDEELVHLGCTYCKVQCRVLAQTSDSASNRTPSETAVTALWRSREQLQDAWSTPTAERASKFGRAPAAPSRAITIAPPHAIAARPPYDRLLLQTTNQRDNLTTPHPPPSPKTTARPRPPTAPRPPDMEEQGRRSPACPPSLPRSP